jgi:hypothetical protein
MTGVRMGKVPESRYVEIESIQLECDESVGDYDMGLQLLESIHRQFKGSFAIPHDPFCI